jgi:hypothetical protein
MTKLTFSIGVPIFFILTILSTGEELPSVSTILIPLLIILILVLLNGFFVAAEFAIIGVRSSKIDQMVQEGSSDAKSVQEILDSPRKQDRYIATAQLGITIASLGLGMYGEPKIGEFIDPSHHQLNNRPGFSHLHTRRNRRNGAKINQPFHACSSRSFPIKAHGFCSARSRNSGKDPERNRAASAAAVQSAGR